MSSTVNPPSTKEESNYPNLNSCIAETLITSPQDRRIKINLELFHNWKKMSFNLDLSLFTLFLEVNHIDIFAGLWNVLRRI